MTAAARAEIERVPVRFVRTARHPTSDSVPDATFFDAIYDNAPTLYLVYASIVDSLAEAASHHGEVLYAVPGSPLVAERTVELLMADPRVDVVVHPALSFADVAWARLAIDPVAAGVRLVDGSRFAVDAAGERGPLLVAQCDSRSVLSEIKLAVEAPQTKVVVLRRLGLADESITTVAWDDLDRFEPDHLTSLYIPELAAPVASELSRFVELIRLLRERCPWDKEQTHASIADKVVEEAHEVVEAIQALDENGYSHLEEELGDLLFQVVFHANLAAEAGEFTLADVARGIHDKLVRRHPHVFGDVIATTPEEVMANWQRIKAEERVARPKASRASAAGLTPPPRS